MIIERVISLVIGYVFGLLETGFIYGKIKNVDIRKHGSGNAGTTNALRTLGAKAGVITFIGDFFKAIIALWVISLIYGNAGHEAVFTYQMYAGLGVILGHVFPFYLKFKGGKGIASTAGVMMMINPIAACIALGTFLIIALGTRYVSVASLIAIVLVTGLEIGFGQFGLLGVSGNALIENYVLMIIIAAIAILKHKTNIVRLIHHEENKLDFKKKPEVTKE